MRSLEVLRRRQARAQAAASGHNPNRRRLLASEVQQAPVDAEVFALPIDYQRSASVQDGQGRFWWLAGYDGV